MNKDVKRVRQDTDEITSKPMFKDRIISKHIKNYPYTPMRKKTTLFLMGKNKKQKILKNKCNWPVNIRKKAQYGKNFTHNAKIK